MSMQQFHKAVYLLLVVVLLTGCVAPPPMEAPVADSAAVPASNMALSDEIMAWGEGVQAACGDATINVAVSTHPSVEAFRAMAPAFTQATGIEVTFDELAEAQARDKQFLEATGKTGLYDVLMMDSFWVAEYVAKNVAMPLDDFVNNPELTPEWFDWEDILPAFRSGLGMFDGTIYGVPFAGETRFLAYRQDLFDKYDKQVPTSLDEMLELARFFNGKEEGLYGIGHRAQTGIFFASGWLTHIYNFGDGFVDQTEWTSRMTEPDVAASLEWFTELLKTAPPDVLNYTHEEATSAFNTGRAAMWFDSTALVPWLLDPERSQVIDKVAFAAGPPGPNGRGGGTLAGWDFAISPDSKNPECAWAFVMFMTSRAMAKEYIANGGIAGRTSILLDPEYQATDPSAQAQLDAYAQADELVQAGLHWIPPTPALGQILDRVGYYGTLPLTEGMSIEEAMQDADVEVSEILASVDQ
jgi:ABC-type glycerol-3-phosphate transport system substrate-binding protein